MVLEYHGTSTMVLATMVVTGVRTRVRTMVLEYLVLEYQ